VFGRLFVLAFSLILVVSTGCGGKGGSANPNEPPPEGVMEELSGVIQAMAQQKQKPPTKLADLQRYEPIAPAGIAGVASGKYVFLWGAGYKPGGNGIVAYEAAAESNGGWVLLEDGSFKKMSAAEFAAAPKAGKR
jgi:hypothetical protein